MAELLIRDSTTEDLPAIARIYRYWVLESCASFEVDPPDAVELGRRQEAILEAGLPYICGEVNGCVVGYAYASLYRPRMAYRFTVEDSIYIDPNFAGHGFGRKLLEALIAICERGPWRQMISVIGDSQNAASIALHSRLGFRMVGTFTAVGFKLGRWVDTVLMQRELHGNIAEP